MEDYQGREFTATVGANTREDLEYIINELCEAASESGMEEFEVLDFRQDPDGGWEATIRAHNINWGALWTKVKDKAKVAGTWVKKTWQERRESLGAAEEGRRTVAAKAKETREYEEGVAERSERVGRWKYLEGGGAEREKEARRREKAAQRVARIRKGKGLGGFVERRVEAKEKLALERAKHPGAQRRGTEGMVLAGRMHLPGGLSDTEAHVWSEIQRNDDHDTKNHILSELRELGISPSEAARALQSLLRKRHVVRSRETFEGESVYELRGG